MSTASQLTQLLGSDRAQPALAAITKELLLTARLEFSALESNMSARRAEGINELAIVLLSQLAAALEGDPPAFPEGALAEVLEEKAREANCLSNLDWAVSRVSELG